MSSGRKSKNSSENHIVLRPGENIGNNHAEADDEFLFSCFYDHPSLSEIIDPKNSKMFLTTRTGAGKTAILRMIKSQKENTVDLDLTDLALNYVANSDILRFLDSLGVDLDLFFQALWKHVFCIEFIRIRFDIKNIDNSKSFVVRVSDFFRRDSRKEAALEYLKKWEGQFFITMDENIKEITEKIESELNAELGVDIEKFKGRAGYVRSLGAEKKSSLVSRARKIVNSDLLAKL